VRGNAPIYFLLPRGGKIGLAWGCAQSWESPFYAALERIQSNYALANGVRGGFVLRKKPLGGKLPGYGCSGFAVAAACFHLPRLRPACPHRNRVVKNITLKINRGYRENTQALIEWTTWHILQRS
jgi:hypothetical protein